MADTLRNRGDGTGPEDDGPTADDAAGPAGGAADGRSDESAGDADTEADSDTEADTDSDDTEAAPDGTDADLVGHDTDPVGDESDQDAAAPDAQDTGPADPDDTPTGPSPTRIGWVVAAFLFFWPLAVPALVLSMRTAEANGTGSFRRARKASVHALDFALGAVTVGVVGAVGLALAVVAAPTYASSLPQGVVSVMRSVVPPVLAEPLGITADDAGPAAPSDQPSDGNPYAEGADTENPVAGPGTSDPFDGAYTGDPGANPDADTEQDDADPDDTEPDDRDPDDTTATAGTAVPDLEVGDCIDTAATAGQATLYRIPVVACSTAHGGEIYAETTASDDLAEGGDAPTQQALWDAADAYCYPQFAKFVGLRWASSELQYWPIAPSEESWTEGDRRILCVVESATPVTGSLRDAER